MRPFDLDHQEQTDGGLLAEVTRTLAAHGAPLLADEAPSRLAVEDAFVAALALSHEAPTLLRALPVFVVRNEATLDWTRVQAEARERGLEAELGLVLDVTRSLAPSVKLAGLAEALPHGPPTEPRFFFAPRSRWDRELAEAQTPEVARRWGFVLNMTLDAFRTLLEKHVAPLPAR